MSRTTLQIPLDTSLRNKAEQVATSAGFSSLQEVVRIFLTKFAKKSIDVGFYEKDAQLSKKAEARYVSLINDAKGGKNIVNAKSFDELVSLLN
jgi:antitoxin component of RelBE/YafQ-DinJ toxin-antitoxin module